jgi:hypothetical protein
MRTTTGRLQTGWSFSCRPNQELPLSLSPRWPIGAGLVGAAIVGSAVAASNDGYYYDGGYRRCGWVRQFDAYGNYIGRVRACNY